jgi:hypothetical protein
MATAQLPLTRPRWARSPFYFNSASHLLRIGREKASNLQELLEALRTCPESSIFHTGPLPPAMKLSWRNGWPPSIYASLPRSQICASASFI